MAYHNEAEFDPDLSKDEKPEKVILNKLISIFLISFLKIIFFFSAIG
jgi:hypothetical protein